VIFLTVGTQLPFDRLTQTIDRLAPSLGQPVLGQIGRSTYVPRNFRAAISMQAAEFEARFREAAVIVAHAGIGTVLKAQQHNKPLVLFPRRARFGEHRNDHQLATCEQLRGRAGIYVADDHAGLERLLLSGELPAADGNWESPRRVEFIENLRRYFQAA
jgi:UDP-N-acetylglucosamine transferase subunit ALG13